MEDIEARWERGDIEVEEDGEWSLGAILSSVFWPCLRGSVTDASVLGSMDREYIVFRIQDIHP